MPDYIEPISSADGHDWPAMLHDLEKRVEVLSDALEGVKLSMRRLVLAEPWLQDSPPPQTEQASYEAPVERSRPFLVETPAPEPAADVVAPSPLQYDDDAREAVRRAVEDAKPEHAPGDWRDEGTELVNQDKPEVSWVTAPDDGSEPEPLPAVDDVPTDFVDDEEAREAVRRAVEAAKAEFNYTVPDADDEEARESVRRTVEQAKGGLGFGWGSISSTPPPAENRYVANAEPAEDPEAAREAARLAIEAAKAEMGFASASSFPPAEDRYVADAEPAEDPEAAREAARLAVEAAKAEMGFGTTSDASATPAEDEEAAREAVRQAVLQARAEMATGGGLDPDAKPVEVAPKFVVPPPHRPERIHPPTITIEDPEGRVELARVYNLLKRLDVAANSSLLNYSSRQVSVQLSDSKTAPDGDNVGDAVRDVFERENDVSLDGLNLIVKLGSDYIRAA